LKTTGLVSATALAGTVLAARPAPALTAAGPAKAASPAIQTAAADISALPRVQQQMVAPPHLPEHEQVASAGPKIVEVLLTIEEKKMVIDDEDTEVWALTYNGSVTGPMIVVHAQPRDQRH
jgi:nitrite reductase (NO-forming)